MTKWEYQVVLVTDHPPDMVALLNRLGSDGWEWVEVLGHSSAPAAGSSGARHVLFRRALRQ